MIVERYPERLGAPKAHALSPRSLEICRQFGLDVRRIRELGTPRADAFWVNFVTNLSGEAVGVLPYERMDAAVLDETPEMIHNIPQPIFEQFVTEHLSADPNVDIRKGVSFDSLFTEMESVLTTVEERATGHKYQIRSRHVIACDGARSRVREFLRIESDGEDSYETMMTIHFNANLRPVVGKRVGMLHWIMDPVAAGFIIGYDLNGNQVLISNFDSDKHPIDTWNEDLCRSVVTSAIGQNVLFDVLSYRPWILSRKVAKSYRTHNVFLAGDAAHSFPPTGGLGLNSGLADVHNLAYKIAAVHKGWADNKILDTYQSERQHVAEVNSKQSVKNGKKIFGLLKTLGTAGTDDIATARKNLYATIRDPKKKRKIDEGIEDQREHFDNVSYHKTSVAIIAAVLTLYP
jgi:2-polyprenyl-6-methoxyphenol hydroxylase-like FAD-dependent oxidoreductase